MNFRRQLKRLDREPIWRRIEDRIDKSAHNVRNIPGRRLRESIPPMEHRNIGGGAAVGTVEAAAAIIIEDTLGVPFGGDTEITDVEPGTIDGDSGTIYTINTDAPFENMAQARAFFEANTGFASLLTDHIDVENVEVLKHRPLRDTYQVKVLVQD